LFADRAYEDDGNLMPRSDPKSSLTTLRAIRERAQCLIDQGTVLSAGGKPLRLPGRTLCLHGDSPAAVGRAKILARLFGIAH
jgi:UPF0271 protein